MPGTVSPTPGHNAKADAEVMRKAMKGMGTDEDAIISVVANRTRTELGNVCLEYKTMYGRDIFEDLDSEIGGNFLKAVRSRLLPAARYDAESCHNAIAGAGTNEGTLIEILATRSNAEIHAIREQYKTLYKKELEDAIKGDTSGHFKRLLVSLVQGNRDESPSVNQGLADQDAKELHEAGESRWGTDESKFNQILCSRSFAHIAAVSEHYKKYSNVSLLEAVENETSGNLREGMAAIVKSAINRPEYFAERCYHAMKGAGTDDQALIRAIATRCEIDTVQIKEQFARKYKKDLTQFVKDDTSGDYEKLLVKLLN
jgi:hypothetical protein